MDFYESIANLGFVSGVNFSVKPEFITESDLAGLYKAFSKLDEIVHMDAEEEMCNLVLRDPVIKSLLPVIHASYSNFFSIHETQLARKILASENPWKLLESFPLYPRYEKLIADHIRNSPDIRVLAFIGCGPLPVTLLLFSKLYGIKCIGIDKDSEAVSLAKRCVKHFCLEKEINIIQGDETALLKFEWDSVLIAGLAEPKKRIFRNLHNIIKQKNSRIRKSRRKRYEFQNSELENPKLKKPISVCYRNYTGMRQLLYRPVKQVYLRGFRKIKEISPSGGVNNTLVFLECDC